MGTTSVKDDGLLLYLKIPGEQVRHQTIVDALVLHTRVVTGAGGGPEKTIINSPRFLRQRGYPMICVYMRNPRDKGFSALERRAAEKSVTLAPIDDNGPLDWRIIGRLKEVCRQYRPAIWHAHDYKSSFLGLLLRRDFPSMKLITTTHGWVEQTWKTPLYYAIDRFATRRYDHVVCVSQDLYDAVRKLGIGPDRCTFVKNAIDVDEFSRVRSSADAKRSRELDCDRLIVGAVGRLSPEKGFQQLIHSFSRTLAETKLNAELWIVGEGPQEAQLRAQIDASQLTERIKLKGFQADIRSLFETLDLFVLSSIREGLPNVVLEAMAMSVPIVCTKVAGVPNLVTDGVNGLLCEPGNVEELSAQLSKLLTDTELQNRLSAAARDTVVQDYNFTQRMEYIKDIYDQVLGRGSPAPIGC